MNNIFPSSFFASAKSSNSQGGEEVSMDSLLAADISAESESRGFYGKNFSDILGENVRDTTTNSQNARLPLSLSTVSASGNESDSGSNQALFSKIQESGLSLSAAVLSSLNDAQKAEGSLFSESQIQPLLPGCLLSSNFVSSPTKVSPGASGEGSEASCVANKPALKEEEVILESSSKRTENPRKGDLHASETLKSDILKGETSFSDGIVVRNSIRSIPDSRVSDDGVSELFSDLFGGAGLEDLELPPGSVHKISEVFHEAKKEYYLNKTDSTVDGLGESADSPVTMSPIATLGLGKLIAKIDGELGLSADLETKPVLSRVIGLGEVSDSTDFDTFHFDGGQNVYAVAKKEAIDTDSDGILGRATDLRSPAEGAWVHDFIQFSSAFDSESVFNNNYISLPLNVRFMSLVEVEEHGDASSLDQLGVSDLFKGITPFACATQEIENIESIPYESEPIDQRSVERLTISPSREIYKEVLSASSEVLSSSYGYSNQSEDFFDREVEYITDPYVISDEKLLSERTAEVVTSGEGHLFRLSDLVSTTSTEQETTTPRDLVLETKLDAREGVVFRSVDRVVDVVSEHLPLSQGAEKEQSLGLMGNQEALASKTHEEQTIPTRLVGQKPSWNYQAFTINAEGVVQNDVSKVVRSPLSVGLKPEALEQDVEVVLEAEKGSSVTTLVGQEAEPESVSASKVEHASESVGPRPRHPSTDSLEVVKNSPKPLPGRVERSEAPNISLLDKIVQPVEHKGETVSLGQVGITVASQPARMQPKVQRNSGEPIVRSSATLDVGRVSSDVAQVSEDIRVPLEFAASLDEPPVASSSFSHAQQEVLADHEKDTISSPQRAQSSTEASQTKQISSKMRSDSLPSVPDLNPRLLRQLEQFQRSQRPWTKVSLSMNEGDDLMLRMKVSSGRVQIRFGTQSVALREGIEGGWADLVNKAASLGIQLDAPEFEARLRARSSGFDSISLGGSLNGKSEEPLKPNRRKTADRSPSGADEPVEGYPKILKWA